MNITTKYMRLSLIANLFLCTLKICIGFISNTNIFIADGIHSLSDFVIDIISIVGGKFSLKKPDKDHPYGYGNLEYVTSFLISLLIVFLSFSIFKKSFRYNNIIPSIYLVFISLITIFIKIIVSNILIKNGNKYNNMILISIGRESFGDIFSSILVIIVIILSQFYLIFPIFKYSNMIGSIIISIFIFNVGIRLFVENINLLIGKRENSFYIVSNIENIIMNRNDEFVLSDYFIIRRGSYYEVNAVIKLDGSTSVLMGSYLINEIRYDLYTSSFDIRFVNIYIEPI